MSDAAFVTIATSDYLPRASVLAASLRDAYGPGAALLALHVGEATPASAREPADLELITVDELEIPTVWDMAFRYQKRAFANALKPFLMEHVLRRFRPKSVIFLDADMFVYAPLDAVHAAIDGGRASIVLTPHFDRPQFRIREPFDIDLLRHGVMNGGFVAVAADADADAFLSWWSSHLLAGCRYEVERGYYGDQHWLDLAPALFGGVHVLRDRSYNAAYWNFPDRAPRWSQSQWRIDQHPLKLFHFSQWRLEQGESVDECMARLFRSDDRHLSKLLNDYRDRWLGARRLRPGAVENRAYEFDVFTDGTPIPKMVREAYADATPPRPWTREHIFGQGLTLLGLQSPAVPAFVGVEMSDLYVHIWRTRADLSKFDLTLREGQLRFTRWLMANAAADYDLPDEALEPAGRTLAREAERLSVAKRILKRLGEAHAALQVRGSGLGDLARHATAFVRLLMEHAGAQAFDQDITTAAEFFAAVMSIEDQQPSWRARPDVRRIFDSAAEHGRYLAAKVGLHFYALLRYEASTGQDLLEGDAILNSCSRLVDLFELGSEGDEAPRAPRAPWLLNDEEIPEAPLPAWAGEQLGEMAEIEPELALPAAERQVVPVSRVRPHRHPLSSCFDSHRAMLEGPPRAVLAFSRSYRDRGRFDSMALVEAAQEALGEENVLVMILDDEPGARAFEPPARTFLLGRDAAYLTAEQQARFVRDYLINMQPVIIVNHDCPMMWDLFRDYGRPLSSVSRLYAILSDMDRSAGGARPGFAATHLRGTAAHLAAVISDNARFRDTAGELLGLSPQAMDKIQVVPQPVTAPDPSNQARPRRFRRNATGGPRPTVLWANSGDPDGHTGFIAELARTRPGYDFVAYGRPTAPPAANDPADLPNLRSAGLSDDPGALSWKEFDVLLHASRSDRLGNLVLAAAAARLPIVAAQGGGASELVNDARGWPVGDDRGPEAYGEALDELLFDFSARAKRVEAMADYVARMHSPAAFAARIQELGVFRVD